jgi:hypothetical protein
MVFSDLVFGGQASAGWWRKVAYAGTKLFCQPVQQQVVYIVPVTDILVRLALVPCDEHGTIDGSTLTRYYPRGECDHQK